METVATCSITDGNCLRLCDGDCCSTADSSGSCHAPAPSYFEEIIRCWRQKLHWRWPGNPNGRLKFHNLDLFIFTRLQLTLRRRLRGFLRSLRRHVTNVKNIAGDDQDRSKFCNYENLCLRDQAKRLKKLIFVAMNDAAIDGIAHCLLSCYHS